MRLAAWFLVLAILLLGIWLIWGGGWEEQFTLQGSVAWLSRSGPWAWAAGVLLLVSDLVLPVPGTVIMSALGYIYGFWLGGTVASLGLIMAGLTGYGLGRLFGEPFARRWLGDADFERGQRMFGKSGGWMIAMSRTLPILPEVFSCTAGLVRMDFRKFLLALACGSVPAGFLFAAIGSAGHDTPALTFTLSLLVPAVLWLIARRFLR